MLKDQTVTTMIEEGVSVQCNTGLPDVGCGFVGLGGAVTGLVVGVVGLVVGRGLGCGLGIRSEE